MPTVIFQVGLGVVEGVEQLNNNSISQPAEFSPGAEETTGSTVTLKLPTSPSNSSLKPSLLTKWLFWKWAFSSPDAQLSSGSSLALKSSGGNAARLPQRLPIARWCFWSLVFFLTTTVSATLGATLALITPLSSAKCYAPTCATVVEEGGRSLFDLWRGGFLYRLSRPVNILVMGIDRVPDTPAHSASSFNGRSDTMLLVRIDPKENSVKILSIPRDTQVDSPELSIKKINQANADGGPALAARIVSSTLNDVPIDRYIRVTTDAFRELVDLVGGVEVFVPRPMHYVDQTQHLTINLEPGWQTLSGEQAEQFARFRQDESGDIGRVQRQQLLLKALRQRLTSPTVLPRLPQMMRVTQKYVDTNLSLEEMLALTNFGLKLNQTDIKMVMLPGRFSGSHEYAASYWIMDRAGRDRVLQDYFAVRPKNTFLAAKRSNDNIRIAIQNASGQPQMSHRVAQYLKVLGFRNIYLVRDWPDEERQTQIIVQQGDIRAAEKLKSILGLGTIEAASTGDIESDLTLRVGKDWLPSLAGL